MFERITIDPFFITHEIRNAYNQVVALAYQRGLSKIIYLYGESGTGKSHLMKYLQSRRICDVFIYDASRLDFLMYELRTRTDRIARRKSGGNIEKEQVDIVTEEPFNLNTCIVVVENFEKVNPNFLSKREWFTFFRRNPRIIITSKLCPGDLTTDQQELLPKENIQVLEIAPLTLNSKKEILRVFSKSIGIDVLFPQIAEALLVVFEQDIDEIKEFLFRTAPVVNERIRIKPQTLPRLLRTDPILGAEKGKLYADRAKKFFEET